MLPLVDAVAGRCCEALLRPNTITAARTADTCDGRRDWEPAGARCVEVAAGAAHSRCARGDAPVGRAGRQTAVFGRGCKARNIPRSWFPGAAGGGGHESRGGADLLPVGLATPHTPPRFRGAGGSPSRECARQNAAQTRVGSESLWWHRGVTVEVVSSSSVPRGGSGAQKLYSEGPEARHCRRSRGVSACSRGGSRSGLGLGWAPG